MIVKSHKNQFSNLHLVQQRIQLTLLAGIILMVCLACHEIEQPLRTYYFPQKHQIYVYSANDSTGREYWEVISEKGLLTVKSYNGKFQLVQVNIERIHNNGINLEDLIIHQSIDGKQISAEIQSGFVFPFRELDSLEVALYRIHWSTFENGDQSTSYSIIRNRRFLGYQERDVMGSKLNCAHFLLEERILSDRDGSIELSSRGEEYYAPDLGLVYRQKRYNQELQLEQDLLSIMTPVDFERLRLSLSAIEDK